MISLIFCHSDLPLVVDDFVDRCLEGICCEALDVQGDAVTVLGSLVGVGRLITEYRESNEWHGVVHRLQEAVDTTVGDEGQDPRVTCTTTL